MIKRFHRGCQSLTFWSRKASRMAEVSSQKRKFIIDTDAGLDDAQAILMALAAPDVDVVAMTTVRGNAKAHQVTLNLLRLLKVAKRLDIPVYKGCEDMILGWEKPSEYNYHGNDGFGGVYDPHAPDPDLVQRKHGVQALLDLTQQHPGEITLVALGPLTNLAMAIRMNPEFGKQLKGCYIMGGNYRGEGNITPCGEFNFYSDPEAAYIVLNSLCCAITMVTWELCAEYSLSWNTYHDLRNSKTEKCQFLATLETKMVENCKLKGWKSYVPCDELAMACAIDDDIITKWRKAYATVELHGEVTRGQMAVDWRGMLGKKQTVRIVTDINVSPYMKLLKRALE